MPSNLITRRAVLKSAATVAAIPTIATASPAAMTVEERAAYHAGELAKAMQDADPSLQWKVTISIADRFALVSGHEESAPIYDGAGFYEVALSNGTHPVLWIERHDYKTAPGHYYTGAHRWGDAFETKPRRYAEKQLRFIRKIDRAGRA